MRTHHYEDYGREAEVPHLLAELDEKDKIINRLSSALSAVGVNENLVEAIARG